MRNMYQLEIQSHTVSTLLGIRDQTNTSMISTSMLKDSQLVSNQLTQSHAGKMKIQKMVSISMLPVRMIPGQILPKIVKKVATTSKLLIHSKQSKMESVLLMKL